MITQAQENLLRETFHLEELATIFENPEGRKFYGIVGLQFMGNDWYRVVDEKLAMYYALELAGEPGIRLQNLGTADRLKLDLQIHLTHLPLLPGWQSGSPPSGCHPAFLQKCNSDWWDELRAYQLEAVSIMRSRAATLLCDDLGLGKTRTALAAASYPAIVLCRKSDVIVWEDECQYAGLKTHTLSGRKPSSVLTDESAMQEINVWIVPYSIAARHIPYFGDLGAAPTVRTMIADEGHELQKRKTYAAQAFRSIAWERCFILTATPMRNRLPSLWALLDSLCFGRAWGSHWDWRKAYCGAYEGDYGLIDAGATPEALERLRKRLSVVLLKRTRAETDVSIPPLTREIKSLELTRDERRNLIAMLGGVGSGQLRTIGSSGMHLKRLTAFRRQVGLIKAESLPAVVDQRIAEFGRVVVWCWHKEVVDRCAESLKDLGYDVFKITGSTTKKRRQAIVRLFRDGVPQPAPPQALIASISALSTGVSLTAAGLAIFVEEDYAPLQMQQASKRTHRFGQRHTRCLEIYLTASGTIDDKITRVLIEKAEQAEDLLGVDGQVDQMRSLLGAHEEPIAELMARIARSAKKECSA